MHISPFPLLFLFCTIFVYSLYFLYYTFNVFSEFFSSLPLGIAGLTRGHSSSIKEKHEPSSTSSIPAMSAVSGANNVPPVQETSFSEGGKSTISFTCHHLLKALFICSLSWQVFTTCNKTSTAVIVMLPQNFHVLNITQCAAAGKEGKASFPIPSSCRTLNKWFAFRGSYNEDMEIVGRHYNNWGWSFISMSSDILLCALDDTTYSNCIILFWFH